MAVKTLDAVKNTHYQVEVTRAVDGDYQVEVFKPAHVNDPYVELELIASRFLDSGSSEYDLNRLVAEIISTDRPSLVGTYTDAEESNGNE